MAEWLRWSRRVLESCPCPGQPWRLRRERVMVDDVGSCCSWLLAGKVGRSPACAALVWESALFLCSGAGLVSWAGEHRSAAGIAKPWRWFLNGSSGAVVATGMRSAAPSSTDLADVAWAPSGAIAGVKRSRCLTSGQADLFSFV